jgi:uncharacterized protein involved in exopolysaccharide biosynthesis/Mrp family chromosome partitioning ATPase
MNDKKQDAQSSAGISLGEVYFILFRQKWKIITLSVAGILGAAILLFIVKPPQYQSEAMLSIRYVVEGKSLNPPGDESNARPLDMGSEGILNNEIATLYSLDLAEQVVQAITPEKILAKQGGGADTNQAALLIKKGFTVEMIPNSSVIRLTFQNSDQKLVQPVLSEIIDAYFTKHIQMHQGMDISNSFLTNETTRLRSELSQTEDALRKAKNTVGVISVEDAQRAYTDQISKIREDLYNAEDELAGHQATLEELTKSSATKPEIKNAGPTTELTSDRIDEYRRICTRLALYEKKEQDYLTQQGFTEDNVLVKEVREQIAQTEAIKKNFEEKYPKLADIDVPTLSLIEQSGRGNAIDLKSESAQVAALRAKIQTLNSQLGQVWMEATNFERMESTISELEQKREVEENNLKYFATSLEQSRISDALGGDKSSGISIIQWPSPPVKDWPKKVKKKVAMVAAGGILGGLAWAFLIELFLDRSVRRPAEVETKLHLPLFISVPNIGKNGHGQNTKIPGKEHLQLTDMMHNAGGEENHEANVDYSNRMPLLQRFYQGLRDRLIVYFEVRNLIHKPKLVAVTSCNRGAGVSNIATGLAASLSETGVGKVLLVNMSGDQGAMQQFYKGKLNYNLDDALEADTKKTAVVEGSLYVAIEQTDKEKLPAALPKRFASLMPKLKASDYDYIIFDMPPVTQTSGTVRLAGLMDMVLLVIEAEKTNQDVVKQATKLLAESKANVSAVFNKARTYVPHRLHQEFLIDS